MTNFRCASPPFSMDRQTGDLRGDLLVENERIAAISRILIKNGTIVVACYTAEAERLGLVRRLPADNFCARVQAIARELVTASSPRSIGVIKRQVFQSYFQSLAEAWAVADKEMIASFGSEDFKEGVAHFVEKRTAMFSGR